VLALRHGRLPRTLHVDEPTPHVDWSAGAVRLLTEEQDWPENGRPRRAGVSSFGVSGTNAHLIIEQAPPDVPDDQASGEHPPPPVASATMPWVVSGNTEAALRAQARRLLTHITERPELSLNDIGRTLASARTSLACRAVVLADHAGHPSALRSLADAEPARTVVQGTALRGDGAVFVFPGQGSQWAGMAVELLDSSPVFAGRMAECAAALRPCVDWSLLDVVRRGEMLDRVDVVQPMLFAVMVSLAELWRSCGVEPVAVLGHSQGEIAAACVAGALSLADAARVVVARSKALVALAGSGGMLSVALPRESARKLVTDSGGRLSIAALNGPRSVVVSGDDEALRELAARCEVDGVRARRIAVDYASHSPHVDGLRDELMRELVGITPKPATVSFCSTVTGGFVDTTTLDADYWFRNLRQTVRLDTAVATVLDEGCGLLVEVSPHPVLLPGVQEAIDERQAEAVILGSLQRDEPEAHRFLQSLARAYVHGADVRWEKFYRPAQGPPVELPTYAFQHERFWVAPPSPAADTTGPESAFWDAVDHGDVAALCETMDIDPAARESLETLAPALSSWRRRRRERSLVDSWRYRVVWRSLTVQAPQQMAGTWLVVTPAGHPGAETAEEALRGAQIVTLEVGPSADRSATAERLRDIVSRHDEITGVLSYLGLDGRPHDVHPELTARVSSSLVLAQALDDIGLDAPLWLVTRGAVAVVPGDRVSVGAAQIWGLGRALGLEQPQRWGGLIDLSEEPNEKDAHRLRAVLAGERAEDQVAVRPTGLFVRRLVRAPLGDAQPVREWRPRGTVLVTGGTGGLGGHVARWLATNGAEHLVLLSRRGPEAPGASGLAAELARLGTRVTITACDIADRAGLARVLDAVPAAQPLTAVVHAAGVGLQAAVATTTEAAAAHVIGGKVSGALVLDELLADRELDAFVLFSSGAASWGSAGGAVYAAANAALDALAEDRRARGLVATSLAWGGWAGTGMALGGAEQFLARQGLRMMRPEVAVTAIKHAIEHDETTVTVADIDWKRFTSTFTLARRRPLIDEIPEAAEALAAESAPVGAGPRDTALWRRLAGLTDAERDDALLNLVRAEAAAVLGHASTDPIGVTVPFRELGFDSLTAVELRNRLGAATGLRLPAAVVFDHPTARALAGTLLAELSGERATVEEPRRVSATDEPIAIIGMACRYPGGIASPEDLWALVANGQDAVAPFPRDRGWQRYERVVPRTQVGGFLYDAAYFDPGFFGISPREALSMDPQQRLLMETSWEVFERVGLTAGALHGSRTAVFIGCASQDYAALLPTGVDEAESFGMTGTSGSVTSGRIAYAFGLEGPALTVDTGCSSSLVALHLAAQSLRTGECELALAGGAAVMATPAAFVEVARQRGFAGDGRCKSFASAADGTGWGEGVGVLLLERLSDARRNNHPILAVVRGSAMNQDGASNGLTAPNGLAQQGVIREALANAGLGVSDVDAVEAHGTGTTLGDPIEAQALLATYGQRDPEQPLWLGSIKSNIAHTQAAAGAAGVIKMVMALQHGRLPKTLHVDMPTTHVNWSAGAVRLLTEERGWPETGRPRRAGVSSFGVSGTNVHVILEQVEEIGDGTVPEAETIPPLVISARTDAALGAQATALHAYLAERPEVSLAAAGHALMTGRSAFEHRAAVLDRDRAGVLRKLGAIAEGKATVGVLTGRARDGKVAFVFPGQGAQWAGMAAGLLDSAPVFAGRMAECAAALAPFVDWSLLDVARATGDAALLDRVDVVQPVLFSVMVSLAELWRSCGIEPAAVVGQSQGEIAAACVAGALSLTDAAKVVALRSRVVRALSGTGGMVSVRLTPDDARTLVDRCAPGLSIAAVNGARSVGIAGDNQALEELLAYCTEHDIHARRIAGDYASHSARVEAVRDDLLAAVAGISPRRARIPLYSTVTGTVLSGEQLDADYWYQNMRHTVRLHDAVERLDADGFGFFIETSAHPVLTTVLQETIEARGSTAAVLGTLRRDQGGLDRFLTSAAEAWVRGLDPDWAGVLPVRHTMPAGLPTYPFQRDRYWLDPGKAMAADVTSAGLSSPRHPILGAGMRLAESGTTVFTGRLSLATHPWLADHQIDGTVVLPGTAMVELAVCAGGLAGCDQVDELTLQAPLVIPAAGAVVLQLTVTAPNEAGDRELRLHARVENAVEDEPWVLHATGSLTRSGSRPTGDLSAWPPAGATEVDVNDLYERMAERGAGFGPAFQGVSAVWRLAGEMCAEVELPSAQRDDADRYAVHPALLDSALHPIGLCEFLGEEVTTLRPFSYNGIRVYTAGATTLRVRLSDAGEGRIRVLVADGTGAPVAEVESLVLRPVSAERVGAGATYHDSLFWMDWRPVEATTAPTSGRWVTVGDPRPEWHLMVTTDSGATAGYADLDALTESIDAGSPVPEAVFVAGTPSGASAGLAEGTRDAVNRMLALARTWSADERFSNARLVVVTRGALAVEPDDAVPDLAGGAVWGLLRSAQNEHPGRFTLLDVDEDTVPPYVLRHAVGSGEPQLAVRSGRVLAARLARVPLPSSNDGGDPAPVFDRMGTVLVTGATGGLGALLSRHLVIRHGVRNLLLVNRSGAEAPGATRLRTELLDLGANVDLEACDLGDRAAVSGLLERIPANRPLTAVIHLAGVFDDGLLSSLTPEQVATVLRPKVDGAVNLHELTAGMELSAFVLYSSIAGTFGGAGQGNYAAANAFLDALAQYRHAQGLPGRSLAWGLWAERAGMAGRFDAAVVDRNIRRGVAALSAEEGLALFDDACHADNAVLVPMRLDNEALRARATAGDVPPVLRGLVRAPRRRAKAAEAGLGQRLAHASEAERRQALVDVVREHAADVLGYASFDELDVDRPFREMGFDSLTAVELRNRLSAVTGLRLPVTLVFDHPRPEALADRLYEQLFEARPADDTDDARIRDALATVPIARLREAGLLGRLLDMADAGGGAAPSEATEPRERIEDMDTASLVRLAMADAEGAQ
ncbi:SDR family NAD(P)-dependent oxidoreductase, partial [Micromonospora eburnea]